MESHFLGRDGVEQLQFALENADDPLTLIESLQRLSHFDLSDYALIHPFADLAGIDLHCLFESYEQHQKSLLLAKIEEMSPDQITVFLRDLEPYSTLPCFSDVVRLALSKARSVPSWLVVPEALQSSMAPKDQLRLFQDQPREYESWLSIRFQSALTDFDDGDDFNYLRLFADLGRYCFHGRPLYLALARYCEEKFRDTYHQVYCVIRVRLALHNSPLSRIDPLRPLSVLVVRAITKEPDWQNISKAASIAPGLSQIPLSMPHFTLKYRIKQYIQSFGVTPAERPIWSQHLNTGDADAVEYMLSTPLFARVIALSLVQSTKVSSSFIMALPACAPQCDVAYLMCRKFDKQWDPILRGWASQNGCVFLDYLTLCKTKGFPVPSVKAPELTKEQQEIYEYFGQR
jgi:hypothetical protein